MTEITVIEKKKNTVAKKGIKKSLVSELQNLNLEEQNYKPFIADVKDDKYLTITENFNVKLNTLDSGVVNFYCTGINESRINLDDRVEREKFLRKLQTQFFYNHPPEMLSEIRQFILNWELIKKQRTHTRIMKDPNNSKILRSVENHQFTAIHFFTRNQVFQIIGKQERGKLIEINKFGEEVDLVCNRAFLGWGGDVNFNISGAVLCTYDQEVFDACIKLWLEKCDAVGIMLNTNLHEIWRTIGNSSRMGTHAIACLKRSLSRLAKCSLEAKLGNRSFWVGGILDDVFYNEKSRRRDYEVIISFNKYMVKHYLEGAYAILSHPIYKDLIPYSKKIYLFLMSHSDKIRKMGLEKWREPLGVSADVPTKELKRNINNAIKELIKFNVLDESSHINTKNEVCTLISDSAWHSKPIFNQNQQKQISMEYKKDA